ncbi:MAG: helix-turn-helix domain-containing protein [Pseudomonadota bacterium]
MTLREWRKRNGYTQKRVATDCGVSHVRISMIERGDGPPSPSLAKRIEFVSDGEVTAAELLGLSVNKGVQEDPAPFTQAPAKLSEEARALGLDPEAIAEKAVQDAVKRKRIDAWIEENREAMDTNAKDIRENGLWSDGLRLF